MGNTSLVDETPMKQIGTLIKVRRKQFLLTQEQAAELAEISARTWRDLEHGRPTVRLDKLIRALDTVGIVLTAQLEEP